MSNENEKPIYVGSAKEIRTTTGKSGIKVQIDVEAFLGTLTALEGTTHMRTWIDRSGGRHRSINLAIWPLKPENVTDYKTHSVKVDTWKPDSAKRKEQAQPAERARKEQPEQADDNLPF